MLLCLLQSFTMCIITTARGSPENNKVCKYWLQGRCTRNPCRFSHVTPFRKSPPTQKLEQIKEMTWRRNPINHSPKNIKKVAVLAKELTDQKLSEKTKFHDQHEPEKNSSLQKYQPKECNNRVSEKCEDVHTQFHGNGFTMVTKLEGHSKAISGIVLPIDSDKLYSTSKDECIRVWDCNTGQCVVSQRLGGEVGCLITEGPWMFVGLPNTVKAQNLQFNAEFSLSATGGQVHCMEFDADLLFAGMEEGVILVWRWQPETNVFQPAAILKGHNGSVCSLVIETGKRLYTSSKDCTIKVWDIQNFECIETLHEHTKEVTSLLCWQNYLLSSSLDKTVKVWAASGSGALEVIYEKKEDQGVITLNGFHIKESNQPILLCSCDDNTVRLYDLPSFTERGRILSTQEVQVIQTRVHKHGLFFTGDASGEVSVWRLVEEPQAIST